MRDKRDMRDARARDTRDLRGFCLKSLLTLTTLLTLFIANAQGLRPGRALGSRLGRPTASQTSQTSQTSKTSTSASAESGGRSIEFNAAPVDMVFTVYQDLVGKTVLKDPQTPAATITLQPKKGQELTDDEKIEAIETVLEMNGIHIEPYGEKFVRALPRKDVRKDGIPLIMDPEAPLGESTRVVSLMIPFKNIAIDEAQKALEGFKSNSGILLVFERTNSILVTDTEQIINRMREIAKAIDIASPVQEVVEYIQIKYANANEVKQVIDNIVQESMKEQEKNGKQPQNNAAASTPAARPLLGGLRRPGQQQQQQAPANNESLVMTVSDADRGMIRGKVVTIADERSNKILLITNAANMKFFKQVIEALDVETTPDTVVKVYRLKYAEAEDVSDMINDLIGNSSSSKDSKGNQNQNAKSGQSGSVTRGTQAAAKKPANQRSGEAKAGELNKDNTTVLADKRINGLVVMTDKELVPTIEQIIESMDIKLSQVLIETMIIEVTLGDDLNTGMDWIQKGRKSDVKQTTDNMNRNLFYTERTATTKTYTRSDKDSPWEEQADPSARSTTSIMDSLVPAEYEGSSSKSVISSDGLTKTVTDFADKASTMFFPVQNFVNRDGVLNNWQGATSVGLGGGANGGLQALNAAGDATNVLGKAFSFIFDSNELGLQAIFQASKTDSHSKYIASPIVMTLDNKEAVIEATTKQQFLTGWQAVSSSYAGSGLPSPTYSAEDIGIKIKATPKINPNGTVMLTVEEEYSQVSGKQTMLTPVGQAYKETSVDVPSTRKMSSDVILENNQTVVFGGLTQRFTMDSETGIPILKDIPFIGKWLFGSVEQTESRTELLVFMTPYVLDDAQAAQVEALRRKKTMSDARAWEDNGWSLSEIADPVSKKEQMRRIKDQWRIQDEERRTKIAIEKAKVERVKQLEKMSKDEREMWLKMHKEELDDEAQDELEEKMLDEKSQE
ncbi:MAG: hypothetical protein KBT68_01170, partial [bacterium]|nr:hypothetical protein [Candidatus Colisoma equi]